MDEWRKFLVTHDDTDWSLCIEIRQNEHTMKLCKEMLDFFHESSYLPNDTWDEISESFARMFATHSANILTDDVRCVIHEMGTREGFYPITEDNGFRLINTTDVSSLFDYDSFTVKEVK